MERCLTISKDTTLLEDVWWLMSGKYELRNGTFGIWLACVNAACIEGSFLRDYGSIFPHKRTTTNTQISFNLQSSNLSCNLIFPSIRSPTFRNIIICSFLKMLCVSEAMWPEMVGWSMDNELEGVWRSRKVMDYNNGAKVSGDILPSQLNFAQQRLILMGRQCSSSLVPLWRIGFWSGTKIFGKCIHPWAIIVNKSRLQTKTWTRIRRRVLPVRRWRLVVTRMLEN
jgi:hypothetical protein